MGSVFVVVVVVVVIIVFLVRSRNRNNRNITRSLVEKYAFYLIFKCVFVLISMLGRVKNSHYSSCSYKGNYIQKRP